MIVSILQLMGFGLPKPDVKSDREKLRVGEEAPHFQGITRSRERSAGSQESRPSAAGKARATADDARRHTVKTPAKAVKASAKPATAAVKTATPAKAGGAKSPAAALAPKKAPPATKAAVKTTVKPVAPSAPKPIAKKAGAPKPVKQAVLKVAPGGKPATDKKAAAGKPASAKMVEPKKGVVTPPARKTATKDTVKSKVAVEATPKTPAPLARSAPAPIALTPVPARVVKPSSRLAQITVPSMAQSVASTAAKSSYSSNMPSPTLVPPPPVAVKKDPKLAGNWKLKNADQLVDEEVLAMPDSEYMNEKQLAFFRVKLFRLKQEIHNSAGETTEHLREDTVVVPDPADRATIEEEHALELRTRDRERKLLKKIEQSITRIDAGDYGYCDETGEPIGVGRLLARPTATLSLEAQQRRELKQKMFGD